jgi:cytoplasmic tRNA 2-thiolation protein 1
MSSQAVCKACMLLEGLNSGLPNLGVSRTRRNGTIRQRKQQPIQLELEQQPPQQQQQPLQQAPRQQQQQPAPQQQQLQSGGAQQVEGTMSVADKQPQEHQQHSLVQQGVQQLSLQTP